jgi:hypothetical protein
MRFGRSNGVRPKMAAWSAVKNYIFNSAWNRQYYATKQVRPIFVEETDQIVVVTVYVYYF